MISIEKWEAPTILKTAIPTSDYRYIPVCTAATLFQRQLFQHPIT